MDENREMDLRDGRVVTKTEGSFSEREAREEEELSTCKMKACQELKSEEDLQGTFK